MQHSQSHQDHVTMMRQTFFVCLMVTIPIFILSDIFTSLTGLTVAFYGDTIVLVACTTFIFLYGGRLFFKGAYKELARIQPGMMTLISLAITVAYLYSMAVVFGLQGPMFFVELATLIDIMLFGHWIEMRAVDRTTHVLQELAKILPAIAHVIKDNQIEDVPLSELHIGDQVLVRAGESIPADGIIVEGSSDINEAMLTGESKPVAKKTADDVLAGSINGVGTLRIKVLKTEKDSYLTSITKLVGDVLQSKSYSQDLANRAALILTITALVVGVATFFLWFIYRHNLSFALERMVSVMVVTCPHALGLAIPLVLVTIITKAAMRGFIIRDRRAFESLEQIETIVFDKTGTLTQGVFAVTDIFTIGQESQGKLLYFAGILEKSAEHALAHAIVEYAESHSDKLGVATEVRTIPGKGIEGIVDGQLIKIGNEKLVTSRGLLQQAEQYMAQGKTVVYLAGEQGPLGCIALADIVRPEAQQACGELKKMGKQLVMLTGDNKLSAQAIADQLGIDTFFAQVLPEQKVAYIHKLQDNGSKVAMVGDGVNDAPALAAADCGIAIGAGSKVSAETASIILVSSNLMNVIDTFKLAAKMHKKIIQNLVWATGYNVIAIPLAAGLLYNYGIVLSPGVGAIAMSLSTVIVAINSQWIQQK